VLLLHGLTSNHWANMDWALKLAEMGLCSLLVEAPQHGKRSLSGAPDMGVRAHSPLPSDRKWFLELMEGFAVDCVSVLDWAEAQDAIDSVPGFGLIGASLGGSAAMMLMHTEERIAAGVNVIGGVDLAWRLTGYPPGPQREAVLVTFDDEMREKLDALDPSRNQEGIPPRALMLAHGGKDDVFPVDSALAFTETMQGLYAAHGIPERFSAGIAPALGHEINDKMADAALRWVAHFLNV
jgi:pimeloyl-ACP methyl ester carboxylesterase